MVVKHLIFARRNHLVESIDQQKHSETSGEFTDESIRSSLFSLLVLPSCRLISRGGNWKKWRMNNRSMSKNGKVRRATEEKGRRDPVRTPWRRLVRIFNDRKERKRDIDQSIRVCPSDWRERTLLLRWRREGWFGTDLRVEVSGISRREKEIKERRTPSVSFSSSWLWNTNTIMNSKNSLSLLVIPLDNEWELY